MSDTASCLHALTASLDDPLVEFAFTDYPFPASSLLLPGTLMGEPFLDLPPPCKTLDALTPDEINHVAFQMEQDVLGHIQAMHGHAYETPEEHRAVSGEVGGAVRPSALCGGQARFHPYLSTPRDLSTSLVARPAWLNAPVAWTAEGSAFALESGSGDSASLLHAPLPAMGTPEPPTSRIGGFACAWQGCTTSPFSSMASLTAHILHRHVPRRRSHYPCLWHGCARGGVVRPFPKRHKLIAHLRSHTHERPFPCSVCGRAFAREDSRDAHEKIHGEERVGPWGCACQGGRVWQSWRGVRRHQATGTCTGVYQFTTGLPVDVSVRPRVPSQDAVSDVEDPCDPVDLDSDA